MPSRQSIWAKEQKLRMQWLLGGKCRVCGIGKCLTFDCIKPTGDAHHRMGSVHRVSFYRQQMRLGNLQLLCSSCNSLKGAKEQPRYITTVKPTDFVDEYLDLY
jgi:hypothetical protein